MISLLKYIFVENWPRKLMALILAVIVWFFVDMSLTSSKLFSSVQVRMINVPENKTMKGLESNGLLNMRISITLTGRKSLLENLSSSDFEVVIDAANRNSEFIFIPNKNDLVSLNPNIKLQNEITKVQASNKIIKLTPKSQSKIIIHILTPIGEPPAGYKFLDVYPNTLSMTVSGPEEVLKKLDQSGVDLKFNLSDISLAQLDNLQNENQKKPTDIVSFPIPDEWKKVWIPDLNGKNSFPITDPKAKELRIDFIRDGSIPIEFPMPINFFVSPSLASQVNPQNLSIATNEWIEQRNGLKSLHIDLYAKGASQAFIDSVKDMIQLLVLVTPRPEHEKLDWCVQFINSKALEERYISRMLEGTSDESLASLNRQARREVLSNRFRHMMSSFRLYQSHDRRLDLTPTLKNNVITIHGTEFPKNSSPR